MGKGKQGQETSKRPYVLWLGGNRKAWNNSYVELAARRVGNYQNASGSSRGGEETIGRGKEGYHTVTYSGFSIHDGTLLHS
jgi:hypothetical protein